MYVYEILIHIFMGNRNFSFTNKSLNIVIKSAKQQSHGRPHETKWNTFLVSSTISLLYLMMLFINKFNIRMNDVALRCVRCRNCYHYYGNTDINNVAVPQSTAYPVTADVATSVACCLILFSSCLSSSFLSFLVFL